MVFPPQGPIVPTDPSIDVPLVNPQARIAGRVPELFSGFRDLLAQEEFRVQGIESSISLLASELSTNQQELIEAEQITIEQQAPLGAAGLAGLLIARQVFPTAVDPRARIRDRNKEINLEISRLIATQKRAEWRVGISLLLPSALAAGEITTAEELVNLLPAQTLNSTDREFAQEVIEGLKNKREDTPEREREVVDYLQRLQQPGENLHSLYLVDPAGMSSQELVNVIREANRYQLPEGMSVEDQREILRGAGAGEEELNSAIDNSTRFEVQRAIKNIIDTNDRLDSFSKEIGEFGRGEISSQIRKQMMIQAFTRPGLVLMQPVNFWVKWVNKPLFGVAAESGIFNNTDRNLSDPLLAFSFFDASENISFNRAIEDAKANGVNSWLAHGYAVDEWDKNGFIKFAGEVLFDPLNLLGFSFISAAVRPLPLIGRPMAAANRGYARLMEVPFDVAKAGIRKIPKTLANRSIGHQTSTWDGWVLATRSAYNKPVGELTTREGRELGNTAIEHIIANPEASDEIAMLGRQLIPDTVVNVDDVRGLGQRLGESIDINIDMLEGVNRKIQSTSGFHTGTVNLDDMVDQIIANLDLPITADAARFARYQRVIKDWIIGLQAKAENVARDRLRGDNIGDIVRQTMHGAGDDFIQANTNVIANRRYQQGIIGSFLTGLTWAQRTILINGLERNITTPFARAYLMFSMYGVGNLLEISLLKTGLSAGLNPFFRMNPHLKAGRVFQGYTGVPDNVILGGTGFNLNLGQDERAFRAMSDAAKGRGDMSRAIKDTRPVLEKILLPKIGSRAWEFPVSERIAGRGIGRVRVPERVTAFLDVPEVFGKSFFERAQNASLANYWNRFYMREVERQAPEILQTVDNLVNDLMGNTRYGKTLEQIVTDPGHARSVRELLRDQFLTGDLATIQSSVAQMVKPDAVIAGEVGKLFDDAIEIAPDIKDLIMQRVLDRSLWAQGSEGISRYFKDVIEPEMLARYMESPSFFSAKLGDIANELDTLVPSNVAELNEKTIVLGHMADMYGDVINVSLESAQLYSRNISNLRNKDIFWDTWWADKIDPMLDPIARRIDDSSQILADQIRVGNLDLPPAELDRYLKLIEGYTNSVESVRVARETQSGIRAEYFTPGGGKYIAPGQRSNIFWSDYYTEIDTMWRALNQSKHGFMEQAYRAAATGQMFVPRNIESVAGRTIAPRDIGLLFGVDASQIQRSMYTPELMAIQGEDKFVSQVFAQAELVTGNRADAMGYTRRRIGELYHQIMDPVQGRLQTGGYGFANAQRELQGLRDNIINIGGRRKTLVSDELTQFMAERVYRNSDTPTIIEEVQKRTIAELRRAGGEPLINNPAARDSVTVPERISLSQADEALERLAQRAIREELILNTELIALRQADTLASSIDEVTPELQQLLNTGNVRDVKDIADARNVIKERIDFTVDDIEHINDETIQFTDEINRLRESTEGGESFPGIHPVSGDEVSIEELRRFRSLEETEIGISEAAANNIRNIAAQLEREGEEGLFNVAEASGRTADEFIDTLSEVVGSDLSTNLVILARQLREASEGVLLDDINRAVNNVALSEVAIAEAEASAIERGIERVGLEFTTTRELFAAPSRLQESITNAGSGSTTERLFTDWRTQVQDDIIPEIQRNYVQDFPDWNGANVVSSVAKTFMPYWHYEAHRIGWIPREFLRHPATFKAFGSYKENTQEGYINIPQLPIQINPLRGTILMGGMRRLFQRDYPEYYDNIPGVAEKLDVASKWGFYLGAPYSLSISMFGAKRNPQPGEVMPQSVKTIGNLLNALLPDNVVVKRFNNLIMDERFRDYLTAQAVSRQLTSEGSTGTELLRKRITGETFSPEEELQWTNATREISLYGMFMEQTGLLRYTPEEKKVFRLETANVAAELMGIEPEAMAELFEDLARGGVTFQDTFGHLPEDVQDAMRALEGWHRWTGFGVALAPSEQGIKLATGQRFWQQIDEYNVIQQNELLAVEANMRSGTMTIRDWNAKHREVKQRTREFVDALHDTDEYRDVAMTIEEKLAFANKFSMTEPTFSGLQELKNIYYRIELDTEWFNPDTGQIETNFDQYYLEQEAVKFGMPDNVRETFESSIARNDTDLSRKSRELNLDLFRIYRRNTVDIVLDGFSESDQITIQRYRASASPIQREEIRKQLLETDERKTVIAEYESRLRNIRENIRETDSELDAWLVFFGEGRVRPRTPKALRRWTEINREFGIPLGTQP